MSVSTDVDRSAAVNCAIIIALGKYEVAMPTHTAKSLFNRNIQSAKDSIALFDAIAALKPKGVDIDWVLRAAVVFAVSALDTYFHDKVKYNVGKFALKDLPPALARFQIQVKNLRAWDLAARKGNVLRNWVTEDLSTQPLQSQSSIADALKLVGIENLWDTIEPDRSKKNALLKELNQLILRRNQISHEGDRLTSRRSGKRLRTINRSQVNAWITFVENLVQRVEKVL